MCLKKYLAYIAMLRYNGRMEAFNYTDASECLKVLAHPLRLEIANLLKKGGLSVGDIANRIGAKSHVTSEHLRLMQRCNFLTSERSGRNIIYSLKEKLLLNILECMHKKFGETNEKN